ncbi:hypothetical protein [Nocardia carnea]|uniref:hypothetical protein n=1 Tax=Nocardia carnea TaxID=37328 RepID=UPI002456C7DC|nr:hypothetical protein [Nocardia carnea]
MNDSALSRITVRNTWSRAAGPTAESAVDPDRDSGPVVGETGAGAGPPCTERPATHLAA